MQRVTEKQFNNDLFGANLGGKAMESSFISIRWSAEHELLTKVFSELFLQVNRCLVVNAVLRSQHTKSITKIILREPLHTNQ